MRHTSILYDSYTIYCTTRMYSISFNLFIKVILYTKVCSHVHEYCYTFVCLLRFC